MKYLKYILIITLAGSIFMSCSEDFLNLEPYDAVSTDEALETLKDIEVALNGVYSGFKSGSSYGKYMTVLPDVMTDEVLAVNGYSNQLGEMYKYSYSSGTTEPSTVWARYYNLIARANNILSQVDLIEADEDIKNDIKGQAVFARGLAYFDLVRLFAPTYGYESYAEPGVPVVLKTRFGDPRRNNVEEVYARIIEDVTQAKSLVLDREANTDGYFSKALCDALLARVYLTMRNWDKAILHSEMVINDYGYSLADSLEYPDMWLMDKGPEIIWKTIFTSTDVGGRPGSNYVNDGQGDPMPDYIPAEWLLQLYDTAVDSRYDVFFRHNVLTRYEWTGTIINKYPTNPEFTENGANMPKVFRLSEQYLIAAEALAERGLFTRSREYWNELRAVRISNYEPNNTIAGGALKSAISQERHRELCFEGHYWFDLKRKGIGFRRRPQENSLVANDLYIAPDDFRWNWPIPLSEMNGNKNMVQNTGY